MFNYAVCLIHSIIHSNIYIAPFKSNYFVELPTPVVCNDLRPFYYYISVINNSELLCRCLTVGRSVIGGISSLVLSFVTGITICQWRYHYFVIGLKPTKFHGASISRQRVVEAVS